MVCGSAAGSAVFSAVWPRLVMVFHDSDWDPVAVGAAFLAGGQVEANRLGYQLGQVGPVGQSL